MDEQQSQRALATNKLIGSALNDKSITNMILLMPDAVRPAEKQGTVSIRARLQKQQQSTQTNSWKPPESWGILSAEQASRVNADKITETRVSGHRESR
jgi:hypothetical protein